MSPARLHPPEELDAPPATAVDPDATAPDGTGIEVHRNFGKPQAAAEIAKALREKRRAKAKAMATPPPAEAAPQGGPEPNPQPSPPAESAAEADAPAVPPPKAKAPTPAQLRARREAQARFAGMKPMHVVEAALFSAGKPLSIEEIAETTGLRPEAIKAGVRELQEAYEGRDSVLEVGKAGTKWAMQVRSRAAEPAAKFAPMEIPAKVLKTLALIAYHQPMKQSELVDMIGTKVYDHVPELVERGLVRAREEGVTKILTTTALFPEYFGLDAEDTQGVRATLAKLVGLPAPPPKQEKPAMVYEEPPAAPVEQAPDTSADQASPAA